MSGSDGDAVPAGDTAVTLISEAFTAEDVTRLRHLVSAAMDEVGLCGDDREDFVLAVHELVTNAVRHGGGAGEVRLTRDDVALTCCVSDQGRGLGDATVALPKSDVVGHRGLWLAHVLTGGLTVSSGPGGVVATVRMPLTRRRTGA